MELRKISNKYGNVKKKEKESTVKGNSNSALTSALEIPSSSGTLVLNICGGNISINNN